MEADGEVYFRPASFLLVTLNTLTFTVYAFGMGGAWVHWSREWPMLPLGMFFGRTLSTIPAAQTKM